MERNIFPVPVVMTVYNDRKNLEKCLISIRKQSVKTVIIINDALSTDGSKKIAKRYSDILLPRKTSITEGRNIVIKEALKINKKYIVMVNSDVELPHNWIKNAIKIMEKNDNLGALGGYQKIKIDNFIDLAISELLGIPTISQIKKYNISKDIIDSKNVPCEAVVYRTSVIRSLIRTYGYVFNEALSAGEDPELSYRIRAIGFRTCLSPQLVFLHKMKSSIKKFVDQQILYGKGLYDWKIMKFNFHYKSRGIEMFIPKKIIVEKPYLLPLYYYLLLIKLISNAYGFIKRMREIKRIKYNKFFYKINKNSRHSSIKK